MAILHPIKKGSEVFQTMENLCSMPSGQFQRKIMVWSLFIDVLVNKTSGLICFCYTSHTQTHTPHTHAHTYAHTHTHTHMHMGRVWNKIWWNRKRIEYKTLNRHVSLKRFTSLEMKFYFVKTKWPVEEKNKKLNFFFTSSHV